MKKEKNNVDGKKRLNGRKTFAAVLTALLICAAAVFTYMQLTGGAETVTFRQLKESEIPVDITADVIPEYKTLERALACMVDDKVYVIVTRGEKPSSGFGVSIEKMSLEEEDGKSNLIVYAAFDDPGKETAISQIITYPLQVAETDLMHLPDTIELRIQY